MYQRQIIKRSKRQICMLGNLALEQPFASELGWGFMIERDILYYLLEPAISFCLSFCSAQILMWDSTLALIFLLCWVKFLFAWSAQLTELNDLLWECTQSKAFLYGFSHKSLMQCILRKGLVLPLLLQIFSPIYSDKPNILLTGCI